MSALSNSFLNRLLRSLPGVILFVSLTSRSTTTARSSSFRRVSVRPRHLFDHYFDHDYLFKLPFSRARDAHSSGRRSTSHHVRFRAVPRTNRAYLTANTRSHFATSNTTQSPSGAPSLPWQCSGADASPSVRSDVSTPDGF